MPSNQQAKRKAKKKQGGRKPSSTSYTSSSDDSRSSTSMDTISSMDADSDTPVSLTAPVPVETPMFPEPRQATESPPPVAVSTLLFRPAGKGFSLRKADFPTLRQELLQMQALEPARWIRGDALAVDFPAEFSLKAALATTHLAEVPVRVTQPSTTACRSGVITGVSPNISEEDLFHELGTCPISSIVLRRVQRLGRRKTSRAVKLVFEGTSLPEKISLRYEVHKVKPYERQALQCYRCQRFNHVAASCQNAECCMLCSGPHRHRDCPREKVCCALCGAGHPANSKSCPRHPCNKPKKPSPQALPVLKASKPKKSASSQPTVSGPRCAARPKPEAAPAKPLPRNASHANPLPRTTCTVETQTDAPPMRPAPVTVSRESQSMSVPCTETVSTETDENFIIQVAGCTYGMCVDYGFQSRKNRHRVLPHITRLLTQLTGVPPDPKLVDLYFIRSY